MTIEDGLILKGTRIVVPSAKQVEILKLIHEGHLGLTKCKLRAKETVYWSGLNDQLEKLVLNCQLCLKYLQSKCKHLLQMSLGQEIPAFPWTKIATDIFHFEGDLSTHSRLHKQVSNHPPVEIYDSTTCSWTFEGHILRIWMTRHHCVRQWSLLCS